MERIGGEDDKAPSHLSLSLLFPRFFFLFFVFLGIYFDFPSFYYFLSAALFFCQI